ncbi:prevent-host-death family protein [Neorhizobium galegae]|uniref:type II toxin-antitoxin system Phd/YefM family antitoxin n=1 Tax=Neorhizobium galegae TaxID=399 RepID=UPI001AE72C23|nr:type II toxin-antitoxin system prevent-host-death family antitoxin [Neorhizobium galegae]MBP2548245.1 prevent-host-death family protein [Neorhizobium galegae]
MKTVSLQEARSQLSSLVDEAANGEAFIIEKDGKPVVKVVPVEDAPKKKRRAGFLKGQASLPDDFDSIYAKEIEDMFYGK